MELFLKVLEVLFMFVMKWGFILGTAYFVGAMASAVYIKWLLDCNHESEVWIVVLGALIFPISVPVLTLGEFAYWAVVKMRG